VGSDACNRIIWMKVLVCCVFVCLRTCMVLYGGCGKRVEMGRCGIGMHICGEVVLVG
jgi:hypothetical protein